MSEHSPASDWPDEWLDQMVMAALDGGRLMVPNRTVH